MPVENMTVKSEYRESMKVWLNGKIMSYKDARVPILLHPVQYGSGVFEGIRAYQKGKGTAIFRLDDHVQRFIRSAHIYSMDLGYTEKEIRNAIIDVVRRNGLSSCYIRPFAFINSDKIGLSTFGKPSSLFIAAVPFGSYFGDNKEKGIKCKISSWRRINSGILPVEAKASGNYINSIIASTEAKMSGFDEAIMISYNGYIAEGPGENIFLVKDSRLITPDTGSDILLGITRDSVIKIAEEIGLIVEQRQVHKEEVYTADEAFFTGTAAEITPIVNVDGIKVGSGSTGPVTKLISERFYKVVHGDDSVFSSWLTVVKLL